MATRKQEPPRKTGRPTKFDPEHIRQARELAKLGATDQQMANFFQVNRDTFHEWRKRHPELAAAVTEGKADADDRVTQSLFARAVGYTHDEEDIRTVSVGGGMSEIRKTPTTRHYPPDVVACIFWLKNRRPDLWKSNPVDSDDAPDPVKVTLEVVDGRKPANAAAE